MKLKSTYWPFGAIRNRNALIGLATGLTVVVTIAAFTAASTASAADWPMYLHDPAHTSFASDEVAIKPGNAAQLAPLWKFNAGAPIGSAVTAVGGRLYFGDWAGYFWAINASDGSVLWKQFVGKSPDPQDVTCGPGIGVDSQPVLSNGLVYIGGGDSAVYALDQNTGAVQWRTPLADPASGSYLWSSVMLANNSLYIGISSYGDCPLVRGGLARIPLDAPQSPVIQYLAPEGGEGGSVWSTPAIDIAAGVVYVTTGNGDSQNASTGNYGSAMVALDATTLAVQSYFFLPLLSTDSDADWGSSPILFTAANNVMYSAATSKTGFLWVLKRPNMGPTGATTWRLKIATNCVSPELGCGSISTPAYDGKHLYVGGGQTDAYGSKNGNVFGVDPVSQSVLWQHPFEKAVLAPLTVVPGVLFVSTYKGLFALNTGDGSELWNDGSSLIIYSQPVVSNGVLYATYSNGDVVAFGVPSVPAGTPPLLSASPSHVNFTYTVGGTAPAKQTLTIFSDGVPLPFWIQPDNAWAAPSLLNGTTSANLTVLPQVKTLGPGAFGAKLAVTAPSSQNGSVNVDVSVIVNPTPPAMVSADVVSAASGTAMLAPGSLFSIYLSGVAGAETVANSVPLPTSLGGISVQINGTSVPILYAGPNQINGQIPVNVQPGAAALVINSGGMKTSAVTLKIQKAAPGIFTAGGGTHAVAQNSDYSLNSASSPAKPGSFVIVYFTGQGPVNLPTYTGTPVDYHNAHKATLPTVATIGGKTVTVYFSGLAPGFVGLGQANLKVPQLPAGEYPLTLQIGGVISNAATISVGASK